MTPDDSAAFAPSADDVRRVLTDARRFLVQQRDLFGNVLPVGDSRPAAPADPPPTAATAYGEGPLPQAAPTAPTGDPADPYRGGPTKTAAGEVIVPPEIAAATDLPMLYGQINGCLKCPLGATRKHVVFGVGDPKTRLLVIGEAPGADEDERGEPFVGRSGMLLTKMLAAVNFSREDVYIANIVKCRPPNNRDPHADEVDTCQGYLRRQIALIDPPFILVLGKVAANTILGRNDSMMKLRESAGAHEFHGIRVFVTYHPAALLRNEAWKRPAWEDLKALRRAYDA